MSYSSLWQINARYYGTEIKKYHNSWLFPPIIWDILLFKHSPESCAWLMGKRCGFLTSTQINKSCISTLNEKINTCSDLSDRIMWEFANQQVFSTQDKMLVADAVSGFLEKNADYCDDIKNAEHIYDRFRDIAEDIRSIGGKFFVFKNTSVDSDVEKWFWDRKPISLKKYAKKSEALAPELVVITGKEMNFKTLQDWLGGK